MASYELATVPLLVGQQPNPQTQSNENPPIQPVENPQTQFYIDPETNEYTLVNPGPTADYYFSTGKQQPPDQAVDQRQIDYNRTTPSIVNSKNLG